ncbi:MULTISPECIES: replication initiation negative regulator SeqA [unclassified Vibrio]|uniref:replication initiation negative regulator SeqA n=1 Tax=unclassified Vibrio TaxID=2614977 RepID=UPI0014829CEA|nr:MULTISPECIES: replication initiation negative regulator SeqA [unclassified Vibrio]MDQ2191676.1 replication initiation negative regulator SeqA [Vibrio sp. A14(2019)]MDQ2197380.1 replication initiation negative regulator SeqA [Vibrio sp. 2017_1457_11]NNN76595.1 replication initiation negative regulator SeqA [Vibrio sp. B7]NNN93144.1 replication initiation negative regulator SeqA [Vibrio sp. B8-1]NNO08685.1 replication initiation negative regulator SeqA [Vibrio sp. B4-12]
MKTIEVDEDLYRYIASQTQHIGESASDILRRLLNVDGKVSAAAVVQVSTEPKGIVVSKDAVQEIQIDSVKEMRSLLISDEFSALKKAIDRFMLVLSTLYRIDPVSFAEATLVKGRKRMYFADNEQTLLASGQTTKPRAIPNTPFWVITNNNTSRKQQMIEQLMVLMNFPSDIIEKVTHSI